MRIDGGCHCGFIRYEGEADPEKAAICHCTDCQTLSGSAFRTVVPIHSDNFRMTGGEPTIYVKIGESGNKRQQAFCPRCGSPIFAASPDDGRCTWCGSERFGSVINSYRRCKYWTRSRQRWVHDFGSAREIEKQP